MLQSKNDIYTKFCCEKFVYNEDEMTEAFNFFKQIFHDKKKSRLLLKDFIRRNRKERMIKSSG